MTTLSERPSSIAKRRAVIESAATAFLTRGYDGVTMDEIADASSVAKQTVYTHFRTKEALFVEVVESMTRAAGDRVHPDEVTPDTLDELISALHERLRRQLDVVLTPDLLRLRRLVIGEQARFPTLARALAEQGPLRAIRVLESILREADGRGMLAVPDPGSAAEQLNWLVMGGPMNDAMLLGDEAVIPVAQRDAHVHKALRLFIAGSATGGSA